MAVVVQRRPGTKQGLVSRLFDGAPAKRDQRSEKKLPKEEATKPETAKKAKGRK